MAKKQFKTESKKLLDMMINSIYTHNEIFLRELISNASDAIDKQYVKALTDENVKKPEGGWEIRITADKNEKTLTITDNGCGMTKDELESNLGTIAKSGSYDFKHDPNNKNESIDVIGQFGVGFYSAFMVADNIKVVSKTSGSEEAWQWESSGADGYAITEAEKNEVGSVVTLHLKEDTEDNKYSQFLEEWTLRSLVKKYSDYIHYPIKMMTEQRKLKEGTEDEYITVLEDTVLNSMTPIWKKKEADVKPEEYNEFYKDKFYDFEDPIKVFRQSAEGMVSYDALMFIPSRAPYNYYTKEYEKGLQLYSSGVMIMDKCADLLPDYFSFVKGVVDSPDLSLNISREMLQHDRQLKLIAKNLEKKIKEKLAEMLEKDRENYEKFYKAFGMQLKWGLYSDYGMHKDVLQDLLMFTSSLESKLVTLKEYVSRMADSQTKIYYAAGENLRQLEMLPQTASCKANGYEVLFLTDNIDEFAIQILGEYEGKQFANVCSEAFDLSTDAEKDAVKKENEDNADLLKFIKESVGTGVDNVRFTNVLKEHEACISNEGTMSANMAKTLNSMPGSDEEQVKAQLVLEINSQGKLAEKLKNLFTEDKDTLAKYSKLLYSNARLASGLEIEDPAEFSKLVNELMAK